jgi:hypothetical protein
MSVTKPTLKPPPLDELDELALPLDGLLLVALLVLLLLPHAAMPMVSATETSPVRAETLILLPITLGLLSEY